MGDRNGAWQLANTIIIALAAGFVATKLARGGERVGERAAQELKLGLEGHMSAPGAGLHLLRL